uniref:Uncharacterized protein n=1 Tax=Arion vulgaris TaxID=1028688 RepID=A0A0B7ANI9_9EUPU
MREIMDKYHEEQEAMKRHDGTINQINYIANLYEDIDRYLTLTVAFLKLIQIVIFENVCWK